MRHRWEFLRFFGNSEMIRLTECVVFRITNDVDHFRLGITLKARGTSIQRNQVKRKIRETFRKLAPILGSFDYNVVVPAVKKMAYPYSRKLGACIEKELPSLLEKKRKDASK
ncbi:ribonuclease P protein component [bacterium]|nr:ribonuclease P protein component [bacterium]